jgi:hypothetical protein
MPELGLVISHQFAAASGPARCLAAAADIWSLRRPPTPLWLEAALSRRLSFHWGRGPVEADFAAAFLSEGLDSFLAESGAELFSFDLGPAARLRSGCLPRSRPLGPAAIRRHTEAALKLIRRHYRGPLAVENYNYYPTGLYGHVTEPGFIREYLAEFGLKLVLDLAHAQVTAHNRQLNLNDYLEELPLERAAEVHLSRPWRPPASAWGLWAVDAHGPPGEDEWALLARLLWGGRLPSAVPIFVEYYHDLRQLKRAQGRLAEMLK